MKRLRCYIAVAMLCLGAVVPANGAIIFSHNEATDPETEGWAKVNLSPPNTSAGPVINDLGLGINAWFTDDNSSEIGGGLAYRQISTAQQIDAGNTFGWVLRANLRVVDINDDPHSGAVAILYRDGTTSWDLYFGSDADGDPIVGVVDEFGPIDSFTLEGAGTGYNLYELHYNPITSSTNLFVNGVERISNYTGFPIAQTQVFWGSAGSHDVGQGNWNLVEFEISSPIPEPSTLLLFSIAILSIIGYRCRKKAT